ncbi:MAG TPA: pentapeptide repeat-containing protein [Ktedonobacteraceae bacterium]|nr:pentapeptide repeat-containing protein [Ktedonobacteraceae bacterium]
MADTVTLVLTRDQALAEIVLAQRDERVPMLDGADLSKADLRKTDLSGGNIREANLSGANLSGAWSLYVRRVSAQG